MQIKQKCLDNWIEYWARNQSQRHYSQFEVIPKWKASSMRVSKLIQSTIIQLKLGHGYFKSYLVRLSNWVSDICSFCSCEENPEHLLLNCTRFNKERKEIKTELNIELVNMKFLFNTQLGLKFLIKFIEKSIKSSPG